MASNKKTLERKSAKKLKLRKWEDKFRATLSDRIVKPKLIYIDFTGAKDRYNAMMAEKKKTL